MTINLSIKKEVFDLFFVDYKHFLLINHNFITRLA